MTSSRALVYVRLSRHRGAADPSTSPQRQVAEGRAYATARGWSVVDVVQDLDVSGSTRGERLERQGIRRVREAWEAGRVDFVITSKIDRLTRSVRDFHTLAEEAAAHGAALICVRDGLDLSTPSGRFVASILAAFAEMEADTIAARTADGIAGAVSLGRWRGGRPPYGYRTAPHPSGRGSGLQVVPEEAEVIRDVMGRLLEGSTYYAESIRLNAEGVKPRRAEHWSVSSVQSMMLGDSLLGRMRHRGELIRGGDGLPLALWEPIVPLADALRLHGMQERKAARPQRRGNDQRLLAGLVRCAGCRSRMRSNSARSPRTGEPVPRYSCAAAADGRPCPQPASIVAVPLERHIEQEFLRGVGWLPEVKVETVVAEDTDVAEVVRALADTAGQMTAPDADVPALVERLEALRARRVELEARPARAETRAVPTGRTIAEAWEAADGIRQQRELLRGPLRAVWIGKGQPGRKGLDVGRLNVEWHELPTG